MPLSADRNTPYRDADLIGVPAAAGVKVFAGALVVANAAGFAAPGATATTLTYLGRAEDFTDNTAGTDAARTVMVRRRKAFKWLNSSIDPVGQASMGKVCYIVDDQTVAATNGGNTRSVAGKVWAIDADGVWVE